MIREEALRLLGLDENASEADVKLAYKEMAQILHPDKYAGNKRLADRANEQFKHVNEARETLLGSKTASRKASGSKAGKGRAGGASYPAGTGSGAGSKAGGATEADPVTALKARLAGIAAARTQLTAQLDAELDRRKVGTFLLVGGIIVFVLGDRFHLIPLQGLAGTALIWGALQFFNSQANVKTLKGHLDALESERKKCEKKLNAL